MASILQDHLLFCSKDFQGLSEDIKRKNTFSGTIVIAGISVASNVMQKLLDKMLLSFWVKNETTKWQAFWQEILGNG